MGRIISFLSIEKMALHGYGLGYAEGKAVLVPFTMPGDCVDALVRVEKKDVIFAQPAEYHKVDEAGLIPGCEAFGGENACGGCDWLMAPYELQLEWKTHLTREVFQPLKLSRKVRKMVPSPLPRHYRNKSFLPAGRDEDGLCFGMYERYSHNVILHKRCLLQPPVMDEILNAITGFARQVKLEAYDETDHTGTLRHAGIRVSRKGDGILVILVTRGAKLPFTRQLVRVLTERFPAIRGIIQNINRSPGNVILGDGEKVLFGQPWLEDKLGGISLRVHYKSFFQVNSPVAELINAQLRKYLQPEDTVLDAYCGIGSIGLSLASSVRMMVGIEEVPEAVADAEHNRDLNGITNAAFHTGKVEQALPSLLKKCKFTAIVLDPPRKGVETNALLAIAQAKIHLILYVSCNLMTLARDVKTLCENGYKADAITPFDMFPQTWHSETVVKLSLV